MPVKAYTGDPNRIVRAASALGRAAAEATAAAIRKCLRFINLLLSSR
jgi:hypothetical protein